MTRALVAALASLLAGGSAQAAARVYSLDQCADQYVLAVVPRDRIVGLSHRADDPDSYLRAAARDLPQRRASYESVFTARPDVVVRYWGGDPRLLGALQRQGVRIVTIEEAADFDGVRRNLLQVSASLGAAPQGARLAARMDSQLARARGAWRGRPAFYLTPGAFTAGQGTLVDAILRAAGLRNGVSAPGYGAAPLERIVLAPPAAFVLGFFDMARFSRWQIARHPALERSRRGRTVASLPGAVLGCPAWFAADASRQLAEAAPR